MKNDSSLVNLLNGKFFLLFYSMMEISIYTYVEFMENYSFFLVFNGQQLYFCIYFIIDPQTEIDGNYNDLVHEMLIFYCYYFIFGQICCY